MLTSIRERATGWIAWAIVILITIPFALWGVNSYFEGGVNVNVAEVDGTEIDYQTYQRALYSERDRVRRSNPNASAEHLSGNVIGRAVIDGLVTEILLDQALNQLGFRISDQQLVESIRRQPDFQDDNGFSRQRYEQVLRFSGLSVQQFEELQRTSFAVQQIQTKFIESDFAASHSVDGLLALMLQQRAGEYAIVDPSLLVDDVTVSDAQIKDVYESNKALYREPEKLKIEYVEVALADLAQGFEPSAETLRAIYDAEIESFRDEERRMVSHILIEDEDETAAENLANELKSRIAAGEDFAALASEYSSDLGSAASGGSLGWISRGVTVPEFDRIAFELEVSEVSDPVRSAFGFHIIRIDEIQTEQIKEFDAVREELVERAKNAQAESEFIELSEELRNLAYEQPDSLDPIATTLGFELKQSDWFTRFDGTGIARSAAVREAAYSDEVFNQGFNSDLIEIEEGVFVVLRHHDLKEAEQLSLADVESEIREFLILRASADRAQEWGMAIIESLNAGADWNSVVAENELEAAPIISPDQVFDLEAAALTQLIYESNKPALGSVVNSGGTISEYGKYAVFQITDIVPGDIANASKEQRDSVENLLRLRFGRGLFENYIAQLRDGVEVSINEELL